MVRSTHAERRHPDGPSRPRAAHARPVRHRLALHAQPRRHSAHVPTRRDGSSRGDRSAGGPAVTYRLAGERGLAPSWRGRAADESPGRSGCCGRSSRRAGRPRPRSRRTSRGSRASARPSSPTPSSGGPGEELPARLGRARPGAGAAGLAGGADGARPLDPICPLHARVPDPRHLGGAAADGFRRRPGPRARLRHGPVPGPGSRGHRRRHAVHRDRGRADHRIDRPAPVPGRPHPPGGLHPRQAGARLRSRHRQPALLRPDGARPRPCGTAGPGAARLVHRPQPRAAAPGRARRLRHQPLDPGQERCHRPPPSRRHGRPGGRGPAARGCLARRRRHRRRGRPAVPAQTPAG